VLTRVLDQLADAGVRRAVVGIGYLGEQVRKSFGRVYAGMELVYSEETESLGTAGAVWHAREVLEGDPVPVLNGNSYVEVNLAAFLAWHRARRASASLLLAAVADPARYGTVETAPNGRVTAFREKAPSGGPGAGHGSPAAWISAGVYLLGRRVIDALPQRRPASLERDVFPLLVGEGLYACRGGGRFIDIGTPESYAEAQGFFAADGAADASRPAVRPFVLLDRDGTLIHERHYLADPDGVALLPGVAGGLRALREDGFALAVVTNQAGVWRGLFSEERVAAVHARLAALLQAEGATLDGIFHCPHHPDAGCDCRKPATGLARQAAAALGPGATPIAVVGDKRCDMDLARALGVPGILVTTGYGRAELEAGVEPEYVVDSLAEAAAVLRPFRAAAAAAPSPAS